jgi:hypothetical protein
MSFTVCSKKLSNSLAFLVFGDEIRASDIFALKVSR